MVTSELGEVLDGPEYLEAIKEKHFFELHLSFASSLISECSYDHYLHEACITIDVLEFIYLEVE